MMFRRLQLASRRLSIMLRGLVSFEAGESLNTVLVSRIERVMVKDSSVCMARFDLITFERVA